HNVEGAQEGSCPTGEDADSALHHSLPRAEQSFHSHGRVRVHQGAEAEDREAQSGDRTRGRHALAQAEVSVEALGHGFLVNVSSDKSYPGLLVAVLEAFEELGLTVLQATASCADTFRLEAVGGENQAGSVDED
uniref:Plant bHLH transcription factor ACT-like domain-containing protein n=1 Tax=Aegilops tauschii subsp. strangulata TaxID=200361 RepID=A0A453APQ4_AEGTS